LPVVAIFLLALAVHWPARQAAYIWDDDEYLLNNEAVQHWNTLGELWVPGNTALYVPMATSSLWVEHKIWGLGKAGADGVLRGTGYHMDNMLLHAGSAVLLFLILRRLKLPGGTGTAWLAAAVCAVHPVMVESVAWVAERKNTLCGVFFLASLYFSGQAFGIFEGAAGKRRDYALGLVFFVAALLSKVAACFLPGAIVALLWWRHRRITRRQLIGVIPMVIMALALGGVIVHFEHAQGGTQGARWDFSFTQRILIAGNAFWFQLGKIFWPAPNIVVYPRFPIEAGKPVANLWLFAGPAAYAALVALCMGGRKWMGRAPLTVAAIYTMGLFPTLGFVSFYTMIYSFVADHYQYLACPVVIVFAVEMAAGGLRRLAARLAAKERPEEGARLARMLFMGLSAGLIMPLGTVSFGVSHLYANPVALWEYARVHNPENPLVLENLALNMLGEVPVDFHVAQELSDQAIALRPDDWRGYVVRSRIYAARGMTVQSALAQGEADKRMSPTEMARRDSFLRQGAESGNAVRSAEYLKALACEGKGQWNEAIGLYQAELARHPDDDEAALRMGYCYQAGRGEAAQAVEIYQQVLARRPDNADAWLYLGFALRAQGQEEEARAALEKARQFGGDAVLQRHMELMQPVK
jgi:tetratricopeptide (TPR) repeat protein